MHGRDHFLSLEALNNFHQVNFQNRNFIKGNQWQYEHSMIEKLLSAPKLFHSYIWKRKKRLSICWSIELECGEVVVDALQMSEHFVGSYSSVFVRSTPVISAEHQRFGGVMEDVVVSLDLIAKVLCNLDSSSAAGPDGLHPHLLKACSVPLSWPLFLLFSKSFDEGMLPSLWKTSIVAPLFKSGSR